MVCLGLIPIPLRSEHDGEFRLYFQDEKLIRIVSLQTKGEFHGIYMDDSGSGAVHGEKSKCNV